MKIQCILLALAGMVAAAAATAADPIKLLGDPATPEQARRTIEISPTTKHVNVTKGDVVRFVGNGASFTWNFNGPAVSSFELNRVAPAGALDHPVIAYVARDPDRLRR